MSPRSELDSLVITMELTLISIIQGVALYWLTDSSRTAISELRWATLPYLAAALFILFQFWSWSLLHTFTIIGWPLEFSHNYLYMGATLLEALMFTQAGNPLWWYLIGTLFAAVVWISFTRDLHLVKHKGDELTSADGRQLAAQLMQEQTRMARFIMPATTLFYGTSALVIWLAPEFFLERKGHLMLSAVQLIGAIAAILNVVLFYRRIAPLILKTRAQRANGPV